MALSEEDLKRLPEDGIDTENPGIYQDLLQNLQGNILKGHGRDYSVHLFVQWKSDRIPAARAWIKDFSQNYVISAQAQAEQAIIYRQQKKSGGIFVNFFLTRHGYEALGFSAVEIPKDQPFTMGMKNAQIRTTLGDPLVTAWEEGYQDVIHSLILLADDDVVALLQCVNKISQKLRQVGVIIHREDGFILRNKAGQIIEHFGFIDGISQPLFVKRDILKAQVNNPGFDKWDSRSPLNIILVKDPNGATPDSYGSYLVYRKLEQNVKAFRDDQRQLAQTLNIDEELAGAYAVGRFRDGTPVVNSPSPNAAVTSGNNFNYDEDTNASKCPFHAHIRKTNPRGDTPREFQGTVNLDEEKGHQIARRAVSFGDNDPTSESESGSGLLFLCFQANIENQFNFMQSIWANSNRFLRVGVGPDPIIAPNKGTQKWPTQWGESATKDYSFTPRIKMKGGEYFFAPSLSCLLSLV